MNLKIASLAVVLGMATLSCADIAFNSFGAGDSYNTTTGWTLGGASSPVGLNWQGDQFVAGAGGTLVSITVAEQWASGSNALSFGLYNDDGADGVGSWITTWSFSGPSFGSGAPPTVLPNAFPWITLTAGQKYWVIGSTGDDTWGTLNKNDQGMTGPHAYSTDSGASWSYSTQVTSAFRVEVESVPEPCSMAALGLGALALVRRRRSR